MTNEQTLRLLEHDKSQIELIMKLHGMLENLQEQNKLINMRLDLALERINKLEASTYVIGEKRN